MLVFSLISSYSIAGRMNVSNMVNVVGLEV